MIPFNKPYLTGQELGNIRKAHDRGMLAGNGYFTKECHRWLERKTTAGMALLTHSCTAALEMAAILAGVGPGDEVIMPSYTFVSTANAFVLRGATPVFVDIRPDTLNINEKLIERAITAKTKVIVPVHYAGVGCDMEGICLVAKQHKLLVVEDAAQGLMSDYKDRPLGSWGDFGTVSFHETKNVISGEGGALLVNNPVYAARAEIVWEKGTNRTEFCRGEIDRYTWVDMGSSYLPGEIVAAFLSAQMEEAESITRMRLDLWQVYHEELKSLEEEGLLRRPIIPENCQHNAHMYYVLLEDRKMRDGLIEHLKKQGVNAVFHYVPLHSSPAGERFGRVSGSMKHTNDLSDRLLRLPLWPKLDSVEKVVASINSFFRDR